MHTDLSIRLSICRSIYVSIHLCTNLSTNFMAHKGFEASNLERMCHPQGLKLKRPRKHQDPENHGVWYPLHIGPWNQKVRSFCLCTVLYYTILYYTILYYTILYYTILYYTILYYTIVNQTVLYHIIMDHTDCNMVSLLGPQSHLDKASEAEGRVMDARLRNMPRVGIDLGHGRVG